VAAPPAVWVRVRVRVRVRVGVRVGVRVRKVRVRVRKVRVRVRKVRVRVRQSTAAAGDPGGSIRLGVGLDWRVRVRIRVS
jgi:hypothetical protein